MRRRRAPWRSLDAVCGTSSNFGPPTLAKLDDLNQRRDFLNGAKTRWGSVMWMMGPSETKTSRSGGNLIAAALAAALIAAYAIPASADEPRTPEEIKADST